MKNKDYCRESGGKHIAAFDGIVWVSLGVILHLL